ncbi:hypothetical protein ACWEK5_28925 [Rhodococcus koreensis]
MPIENPDLAAAVASVELPDGVPVVRGQLSKDSDYPGMQAAGIDICDLNISSPDELRPIATQYAKALKQSPLSEQLFAVYVANFWYVDGQIEGESKLKDPDFQMHLWNGMPSAEAEQQNWQVVGG